MDNFIKTRQDMPVILKESLHRLRHSGNVAVHPTTDLAGVIIPVAGGGETDFMLDTLEALFAFYFVAPSKNKERYKSLNKKTACCR